MERRGRRGTSRTPPPVPIPASRPLLAGPRRAPQRGRGVGRPPARIHSPRGSSVPPVPARLLRTHRVGPGGSPPLRRARPLTFTFPASRRPSCPQRHQTAPPRERGGGGGRTRTSLAAARSPPWPWSVDGLRTQAVRPCHSLRVSGSVGSAPGEASQAG